MMRDMGIYTIYPKPNLSKRFHAQYVRPYLLRNLTIDHPDQVWGVDITYIRMKKGFMYLFLSSSTGTADVSLILSYQPLLISHLY